MESMTGYAFTEDGTAQFSYSVEIKSLNSRYCEVYVNLPRVIKNEEHELHTLLKKRFVRGKIELNVDIYDWTVERPAGVNAAMIKKYYVELDRIMKELGLTGPLQFESILALDGVSQRERTVISRQSRTQLYAGIEKAIRKTEEMRRREGTAVKKDLAGLLAELTGSISLIKGLSAKTAKEKKEALKKRIETLMGSKMEDIRYYAEVAILADKIDINEEIVRFRDHIGKFGSLMKGGGQTGKKLDFLAQELFREINTIGAKTGSSEIAHLVVDVKNQIEMIREHVRNLV
ncbi:MAG: YicC family protein [Chrysiogenales bacterium]|nr:MAG: YicC family protein [Chrysiogenales bacterium]